MVAETFTTTPGKLTLSSEKEKQLLLLLPKILFQTEPVTDKDKVSFQTIELVRKDQALVQLLQPQSTAATPQKPTELFTGKHTRISDDKRSLLSEIDGYPLLSIKTGKEIDLVMISMIPLISISDDKMSATANLYPPVHNCQELNSELLLEILEDSGIRTGISSTKHIDTLLQRCKENHTLFKDEIIARGLLPLDGKDSFLRFEIEVGPLPGKIMGNGKIDFRERKMFVGVAKGQTIATQVPPTDGTPGMNVLGSEVPQIPGRNLPVTVSDDAEYNEESGIVSAVHSGILSLVNENSIKVCAKQVIPGNVDYNTGNVESQDAVEIGGTILPGFKVKTHGDLLLNGNARSAIIKCKGNLVVKGGLLGKKCRAKVSGDADFSFMEQGRLRVKGKVIIRKQAYHARIMATGEIHCIDNSQIMAGLIMSASSLNLGNVGSANSPPALLAAGIAPGRYLRYLKMRSQLFEIEQERLTFLQRHGMKQKTKQRKSLEKAVEALHTDMKRLNLIPTTNANSADNGAEYLRTITISIQGKIFSETELQIGNATTITKHDLENVRFSLDTHTNTFIETSL